VKVFLEFWVLKTDSEEKGKGKRRCAPFREEGGGKRGVYARLMHHFTG